MKCVRKLLFVFATMLPFTAFAGNSYLIDFVVMNEGYGLEERDHYEAIVARIASRYGMEKVRAYDLTQHLGGGIPTASRLNVWEVPEGAMQKLGADPDYQAIVPYRDRIHNMKEVSLFMAGETLGGREPTADTILVDLVVMKGGRGLEDRKAYEARIEPIAAQYGMTKFATYDIARKMSGTAPDGIRVNLWALPDPSAMGRFGNDPDYKKQIPNRDRIHQMDQVTLFFAQQSN